MIAKGFFLTAFDRAEVRSNLKTETECLVSGILLNGYSFLAVGKCGENSRRVFYKGLTVSPGLVRSFIYCIKIKI